MKSNHKYQWLLFDADGTLFDYDLAEAKALEGTFRDYGLPFEPRHSEAYRVINHQVWVDFENGRITAEALRVVRFSRLFEATQIQLDGAEAFSAQYLRNLARGSDLMPGAEALVRELHGKYHLAIITNGLRDVQRPRLAASPLRDVFDEVVVSEEIGVAKPDPQFFDVLFQRIGFPPKETALVIGDSLTSDIQGGLNYGLDTCWFNPLGKPAYPAIPARYEIRRLEDLMNILA